MWVSILQLKEGKNVRKIELDEVVSFLAPGVERFMTIPNEVTEGDASFSRRQFVLLESDERYLNFLGLPWEAVTESGVQRVVIHHWPVPTGYNVESVCVNVQLPPGYPDTQIDMAYFYPALSRKDGRSKVKVMQRAIASMGLGTQVYGFEADLMSQDVIRKLASCDVLFGCMDSVDGRHVLNKLASYYLIPLIDVGVRIDADGYGGIDKVCAAVHYIQPGGSSLMSRGVYSQEELNAAFMKRQNPEQYSQLLKEGYVRNARVDQPAVISINMQAASLAVNEFLARVHSYRVEPNSEYAYRCQVLSDPAASLDSTDGEPCQSFAARMGYGDAKPLLGLHGLLN